MLALQMSDLMLRNGVADHDTAADFFTPDVKYNY